MKTRKQSATRIIAAIILISIVITLSVTLQSCEISIESEVETQNIEEEGDGILQFDENFVMQDPTDRLVLYTWSMNIFTLTPAINIFRAKYPYVEVEIIHLSNEEYAMRLTTELAAGGGPDLIFAHQSQFPDIFKTMSTGIFANLNNFIANDDEFNLYDYVQGVINGGILRGRRYIMPIEYSIPILTTTQEILDAEGITPRDFNTFDGFLRTVNQFNERHRYNPDKSALINWHSHFANLNYFFPYSGISFIDYNANRVAIDEARFKNIMDFVKAIDIRDENMDSPQAMGAVVAANFEMANSGAGLRDQHWLFNNNHTAINLSFLIERVRLDRYNLTPLMFTLPNINNGMTADILHFAAIPQASPNQINAWNLLKILLSDEIQAGSADTGSYLRLGIPVRKNAVSLTMRSNFAGALNDGLIDEETIYRYAEMIMNVDSAQMMPRAITQFILDEMIPYLDGTRSFDDAFARLVSRLEIYVN